MHSAADTAGRFYTGLPVQDSFAKLADPGVYAAVPEDWWLGVSDIAGSTAAILAGRYKEVNTAAAAVIAAVSNALPGVAFPFVFGGDGASFAVPPAAVEAAGTALASTASWIAGNFGLSLRVAMLPVSAVRAAGLDLRVARFAVSDALSYAMFAGGGIAWAEERMKAGQFLLPAHRGEPAPDLSGLSCRFAEIPARRGSVLSLIVTPAADPAAFEAVALELLHIAEAELEAGSPLPQGGPRVAWSYRGWRTERLLRSSAAGRPGLLQTLNFTARWLAGLAALKARLRLGRFDAGRYLEQVARNSDFRKFDDALRMTLDCSPATVARIEAVLRAAEAAGSIAYGLHRQDAALMTCYVPVPSRADHVHFIDGAAGGYAMAAKAMKDKRVS